MEAALCDDYVAFVDDDDAVHPDALRVCYDLIRQHSVGAVCTNEVTVDADFNVMSYHRKRKTYESLLETPRAFHHVCVFRSSDVDPRGLDVHNKYNTGVDWFIKASAAQRGGGIHVMMDGGYWTRHPGSLSAMRYGVEYERNIVLIRREIAGMWNCRKGMIPSWNVDRNCFV